MNLSDTILFKDVDDVDKYETHIKQYERGELIFPEEIKEMGIVLSGCIKVYKNDLSGGINIVEYIKPGAVIFETDMLDLNTAVTVTYICDIKTEVAYFNYKNVLNEPQLAQKLIVMMAESRFKLRERTAVVCGRSIRNKLKCYFEIIATKKQKKSFNIPVTMGELADLMSVDRSAMSREIKKMKEEKLIKTEKHNITILWEMDF